MPKVVNRLVKEQNFSVGNTFDEQPESKAICFVRY